MDAGAVLVEARRRAGLNQSELARTTGVARSSLVAYEAGAQSPTVRQLDRLVAACGLRVRPVLERRTAALDVLVEAALTGDPEVLVEQLAAAAATLAEQGVAWAADGATALALQGLAVPGPLSLAVVDDEQGFRRWLRLRGANGFGRKGWTYAIPGDESREDLRAVCERGEVHCGSLGFVRLRLVDALPPLLAVEVPVPEDERAEVARLHGLPLVVPVLPGHEVAASLPQWGELVAAVQRRRTVVG